MAAAKKLPSGSWRVQVFSHYEYIQNPDSTTTKKRVYESFTCDDPSARGRRKVEQMAAEYAANKERIMKNNYTLEEALKKYIESKSNVLSPTAIRGYETLIRNTYPELLQIRIQKLTSQDIQNWVNRYSLDHSPKSVANAHGLISAVLSVYEPSLRFNTKLPKSAK